MNMRRSARWVAGASALIIVVSTGAWIAGRLPGWVYDAVLIAAFPVLVLSIAIAWMAQKGEPDIPFIGY